MTIKPQMAREAESWQSWPCNMCAILDLRKKVNPGRCTDLTQHLATGRYQRRHGERPRAHRRIRSCSFDGNYICNGTPAAEPPRSRIGSACARLRRGGLWNHTSAILPLSSLVSSNCPDPIHIICSSITAVSGGGSETEENIWILRTISTASTRSVMYRRVNCPEEL